MTDLQRFSQWISESGRIVFFGGAGVSVPSGIPDFRSAGGLYREQYEYPPETVLSASFFRSNCEEFYRFYKNNMIHINAVPNAAHQKLAQLEANGKLLAVVTQNIDGLHQSAGSKCVYELHGSVFRNHCMRCGRFYTVDAVLHSEGVPKCECGGTIKPDVVLYEEPLDAAVIKGVIQVVSQCDLLIVGGTSLAVYPAAGLIQYKPRGAKLAVINRSPTSADSEAGLVLRESIDSVFEKIIVE